MRLLQIVPLYDSYHVFLRELTAGLVADGHEVLTLCRTDAGLFTPPKAETTRIRSLPLARGASPLGHLKAARQVARIVQEFSPNVVHAHFSAGILTAALSRRLARAKARWLGTFQGLQFPCVAGLRGALTRRAEAFAATGMDEAWVLTEDDAEALRQAAPAAKVHLQKACGFGCADRYIDTPPMSQGERTKLRDSIGVADGDTALIFVGRLVEFKGFHLAARAFMEAAENRKDLHWMVVGEKDPLHPTGLSSEEWQRFSSHPRIHWLHAQDDLLPWLDGSDAMLFPTSREGMPVSVMEALARNLPVLTNRVRGCRELIREGENGLFFASPEVGAVREVLERFTPFRHTMAAEHLRRSAWVKEARGMYGLGSPGTVG